MFGGSDSLVYFMFLDLKIFITLYNILNGDRFNYKKFKNNYEYLV